MVKLLFRRIEESTCSSSSGYEGDDECVLGCVLLIAYLGEGSVVHTGVSAIQCHFGGC